MNMLNKLVQQMKRKVSAEIKDRSIKIVSLSPCRLIVDTGKKTYQTAVEYFEYIKGVLSKIDIFREVGVSPEPKYWRLLLYQSPQKMIGVQHGGTSFDVVWKEVSMLPPYLAEQLLLLLLSFVSHFLETGDSILREANKELGEL